MPAENDKDHAHCQVNRFKLYELLLFSTLGHEPNFLNLFFS